MYFTQTSAILVLLQSFLTSLTSLFILACWLYISSFCPFKLACSFLMTLLFYFITLKIWFNMTFSLDCIVDHILSVFFPFQDDVYFLLLFNIVFIKVILLFLFFNLSISISPKRKSWACLVFIKEQDVEISLSSDHCPGICWFKKQSLIKHRSRR